MLCEAYKDLIIPTEDSVMRPLSLMTLSLRVLIVFETIIVMFSARTASAFGLLARTRRGTARASHLQMSLLDGFTSKSAVDDLLGNALGRAMSTLNTKQELEATILKDESENLAPTPSPHGYADNPCVHFTSLAHLQWEYVLRPGIDSAIDATCGNGHDSCEIAKRLFPNDDDPGASELLCIDVQQMACDATQLALEDQLDPDVMNNHVKVIHASHAPLPITSSPLALVCWNLGYLPKSDDKATYTKTESTLTSIADAALQLRVGGLLSVMTYPKSNANEDFAVHALFECLALLTSRTIDWRDYLESIGEDPVPGSDGDPFSVKKAVTSAMDRIFSQGHQKQTWRAMEHKMMGRPLSPMLLTVTRVK
jgi:hypothetical protein